MWTTANVVRVSAKLPSAFYGVSWSLCCESQSPSALWVCWGAKSTAGCSIPTSSLSLYTATAVDFDHPGCVSLKLFQWYFPFIFKSIIVSTPVLCVCLCGCFCSSVKLMSVLFQTWKYFISGKRLQWVAPVQKFCYKKGFAIEPVAMFINNYVTFSFFFFFFCLFCFQLIFIPTHFWKC